MNKSFPAGLLLLLSVDIVGSAAFKADAQLVQGQPQWVNAFKAFYNQVPSLIQQQREELLIKQQPHSAALQLWKAIGDQLVFVARPSDASQLEGDCLAFVKALQLANSWMLERWGVALHGVAWAFQEDGRNVTFRFQEPQLSGGGGFDLIGPDVDLGFRLVALAPQGQVLVPLELWSLLPQRCLHLELIGEASLKGILLDPYPLLRLNVVV